jgi:hypothetical protein
MSNEMELINKKMREQIVQLQEEAYNRGFQNCLDFVIDRLQNPPDNCFEYNSFNRLYFVREIKNQIEGMKK